MYWKEYFRTMLLDAPCYQAPVACLIYLLGVVESEQLVHLITFGGLHCVVHSPR